jgi:hypothetical protein
MLLGGKGTVQNIFTHGSAEREYARSRKRVLKRFRPIDVKTFSARHLAHSEDLTDVLLCFDHLVKPDDRITGTEMLHERFKVPVQFAHRVAGEISQQLMKVTPDALVTVAARVGSVCRPLPFLV